MRKIAKKKEGNIGRNYLLRGLGREIPLKTIDLREIIALSATERSIIRSKKRVLSDTNFSYRAMQSCVMLMDITIVNETEKNNDCTLLRREKRRTNDR